jgi:hypothetical protein
VCCQVELIAGRHIRLHHMPDWASRANVVDQPGSIHSREDVAPMRSDTGDGEAIAPPMKGAEIGIRREELRQISQHLGPEHRTRFNAPERIQWRAERHDVSVGLGS